MTAFDVAQRYVGIKELAGAAHHPLIQWWHMLCDLGSDQPDETPWCSAFVNGVTWECRLPRTKSAAARSWLAIGEAVPLAAARVGFDVVVLTRGSGRGASKSIEPNADGTWPPGHVGFFAGLTGDRVLVLGGNQGDTVSIASFPTERVLGVRRLA